MENLLFVVTDRIVVNPLGGIDISGPKLFDPFGYDPQRAFQQMDASIRLKYPSGMEESVAARIHHVEVFLGMGNDPIKVACFLKGRRKEDVPVGTEVWYVTPDVCE